MSKQTAGFKRRNRIVTPLSGPSLDACREVKAERQNAEHDPWAEFLPDSPENQRRDREQVAYGEACCLDAEGKYDEADRVLRKAGVSAAVVEQRRKHVTWRLTHGKRVEESESQRM